MGWLDDWFDDLLDYAGYIPYVSSIAGVISTARDTYVAYQTGGLYGALSYLCKYGVKEAIITAVPAGKIASKFTKPFGHTMEKVISKSSSKFVTTSVAKYGGKILDHNIKKQVNDRS